MPCATRNTVRMSIFSVGISLRSGSVTVDELTALAGAEPTRSHSRGDRISPKLPSSATRPNNYWSKRSDIAHDTWTLEPHWPSIAPILEALAGKTEYRNQRARKRVLFRHRTREAGPADACRVWHLGRHLPRESNRVRPARRLPVPRRRNAERPTRFPASAAQRQSGTAEVQPVRQDAVTRREGTQLNRTAGRCRLASGPANAWASGVLRLPWNCSSLQKKPNRRASSTNKYTHSNFSGKFCVQKVVTL